MSMYKKVDTSLNFVEREKEIVEYWNEKKVFEKSMKATEGKEEFSFYDGPPTANGKPHIGVGNDVWIGQNVTVMPGIYIGDGAIIAANSGAVFNNEAF